MTSETQKKLRAGEISDVDIADATPPEGVMVMFDHKKYVRHVAVLALAVFAALVGYDTATAPAAAQAANSDGQVMTVAPTKRSAAPHPPTSVPIPFARPQITGPAPLPAEERGLPGD
jgi:hypothetical protein